MEQDDIQRRTALLAAFFDLAPMKHTFGMSLSFDAEGRARFELPHKKGFEHALKDTHGGVIATLIDNAGWFTAATRYDCWVNTAEMTVRLHEPAKREDLIATGQLVRAGSKLAVTTMEVRSRSGRLVATGSGAFVVSTKPIAPPDAS